LKIPCFAVLAILPFCVPLPAIAQPGQLVIVGGGLEPDNTQVYQAFLNARPQDAQTIVIIAAGSDSPTSSARAARDAMVRHGAHAEDIEIAEIALRDDQATRTIDESRWARNVDAQAERERLTRAGAIWFTGGDQSRITGLLMTEDGADTAYLAALRKRHAQGAVIGGTSAGAAIMSGAMIGGGDSLGALLAGDVGEELTLVRGLNFLTGALIDQHFGERARLGRLAAALARLKMISPLGFGIDEDTALVISPDQARASVVGSGYVTLLDARQSHTHSMSPLHLSHLLVGLAAHGDSIDIAAGSITPGWHRKTTLGREYHNRQVSAAGGMAAGRFTLADAIGEDLLDNAATQSIERYSFANGHGVSYRFTQTDQSRAAWGRDSEGRARYTVSAVRFDIAPVTITIEKETEE